MKATSGMSIGIALETFNESSLVDENGIGKILIFINLNYGNMNQQIKEETIIELKEENHVL